MDRKLYETEKKIRRELVKEPKVEELITVVDLLKIIRCECKKIGLPSKTTSTLLNGVEIQLELLGLTYSKKVREV